MSSHQDKISSRCFVHIPVMLHEVLDYLSISPGMTIVDCTVGTGAHAQEILKALESQGRYIAIDRDKESLALAEDRLKAFGSITTFIHDDFRNIDKILDNLKIKSVDGIFFDLGLSSYQLDTPERGFSMKTDAPLDMRMDRSSYISAYDLINFLSETEISSILKSFGEERWHNRIAHYLVEERACHPITSTGELSRIVLRAIPYQKGYWRIHPATRTFQAFRIAVNRELESLEGALKEAVGLLKKGGRICVISFHSLEDRIVKFTFRDFARRQDLKILTKKPIMAERREVSHNPRCRSAKMRVAQKI
ncbi:MAG: 16S rRNA (cytosine(1402)-N(4))-methyltransferase RsmH [Candidatus Omnitrophota bacterium]